jgi:hypothetical protein
VEIEWDRWGPGLARDEPQDIVPDTACRDLRMPGLAGGVDMVPAGDTDAAGAWVSVAAAVEDGAIDIGPPAFRDGDTDGSATERVPGQLPRFRKICRQKANLSRSWPS